MFEVLPNVIERFTQIIYFTILTKIVHNLKGSLEYIKGNLQLVELKQLEFHAIQYEGILCSPISD